jgi:hypothetical protein
VARSLCAGSAPESRPRRHGRLHSDRLRPLDERLITAADVAALRRCLARVSTGTRGGPKRRCPRSNPDGTGASCAVTCLRGCEHCARSRGGGQRVIRGVGSASPSSLPARSPASSTWPSRSTEPSDGRLLPVRQRRSQRRRHARPLRRVDRQGRRRARRPLPRHRHCRAVVERELGGAHRVSRRRQRAWYESPAYRPLRALRPRANAAVRIDGLALWGVRVCQRDVPTGMFAGPLKAAAAALAEYAAPAPTGPVSAIVNHSGDA